MRAGSGSYGDCSLVERAQDGQFYVLKEIKIEGLSDEDKAKSFDEVQLVLRTVEKHPYIVKLTFPSPQPRPLGRG